MDMGSSMYENVPQYSSRPLQEICMYVRNALRLQQQQRKSKDRASYKPHSTHIIPYCRFSDRVFLPSYHYIFVTVPSPCKVQLVLYCIRTVSVISVVMVCTTNVLTEPFAKAIATTVQPTQPSSSASPSLS
ncbi:unnamed protein product [Ceratitis capitata]|uniref:(Mediterranean fruit fly) hypothetical protein n=1 Tax=Ceratitis capitata TaxID=7213 RepID=A0A811VHH3_CERCA|nr:unnamed protein product [Ceratitis capitata]